MKSHKLKQTKFKETTIVEDYVIQKLQGKGWKFIPADDLERESFEEPLLIPNLVRALKRINQAERRQQKVGSKQHTVDRETNLKTQSTVYHLPPTMIGDEELNKVLNELKLTGTGIEGAKRILNFYKFGVPVKFEKEKVVKYVQLFDFDDIENNEFIISRQVNYDGRDRIRTDIILYINGIPLVNIECKNPTDPTVSWYNAYRQIKDYENTVPELYKYVQIGIAAESQAKYFPIVPWQEDVRTHEWREELKDSTDSTLEMLSRDILIDIISNFLFFRVEFGEATKVITRYMQYRAANKMVERVMKNLRGEEDKDKGLVWHWQGSGKTLTMIFAANKLFYLKELENPTIFFIVDRIELEEQLYKEFYSLDMVRPDAIGSIGELREVLSADDYRGNRGVFITLIHKFRPEELQDLQTELQEISRVKKTIMTRRNVIAFIDEGHRSQYGLLAAQMKSILKDAFFFALTGTPISKRGRDTYLEFSYPPEELYLDRYFITDSIRDGFTVKIVYQPRLEEDVHLKKDMLEVFLEIEFEELPEEAREEVEERVKEKLNTIKLFLENPNRIEVIGEDIAQHFNENVDGRFKAMVVAASRRACVLYKNALDKHLPSEYSEVVMTYTREDEDLIHGYVKEAREKYGGRDVEDVRKDVVDKFREQEFPKILIVTDMLLTGFDAPLLQTMYFDKPLKEHRLLQAVARTNRPFKDIKEAGVVIDYVGILKEFKKALEMYSTEDIEGALVSYDSLRGEFIALIEEILEILKDAPRNYERETLLKAVEVLTSDGEREKEFVEKYRKLRKVFELLGPDEVKLSNFETYKWISAIYTYYMKVVAQEPSYGRYVQKYFEKTIRFVHKSTEIDELEKGLPTIAFDEEYLSNMEERVKSKKEKAANILFTLNRLVLVERHKSPIYESLAERVERLVTLWREKTKDYERIYTEGVEIIHEISALSERQKSLVLSDLEYSILLTLENRLGTGNGLIKEVRGLSKGLKSHIFPGWIHQPSLRKELERSVRRFVRGLKNRYNLSLDEMNDLYENLIEQVRNYGA